MFFNAKTIGTIGAATDALPKGTGDAIAARRRAARVAGVPATANIIQDYPYTPFQIAANAVGAFSQAHKENRVYRSGNPAGAIFICRAGGAS
jgi:hypothetical protein